MVLSNHQLIGRSVNLALGDRLDRGDEFAAGHRMAGKPERLERAEARALLGEPHQGRREIRQVGPGVLDVERPGIGQAAALDLLGDHQIEPRAAAAAEEIAGAQHDGAHAAVAGLADALLDLDAHRALAGGRLHRRGLVEHRRHAASVVPDAAGKQQRRAVALGRRDGAIGERQRVLPPFGDDRIERVEHHVAACAARRPPRRASPPRPPRRGAAPRRRGRAAPGPSPASRRRGMLRRRRSPAGPRRRARGCVPSWPSYIGS